jgi:hypothetical protein
MRISRDNRRRPQGDGHPVWQWLPVAGASFAAMLLPRALVLPALSLSLLAGAMLALVLSWRNPPGSAWALACRDLAGLFTFLGYCAALLSDPAEVLPLLETRPAAP